MELLNQTLLSWRKGSDSHCAFLCHSVYMHSVYLLCSLYVPAGQPVDGGSEEDNLHPPTAGELIYS